MTFRIICIQTLITWPTVHLHGANRQFTVRAATQFIAVSFHNSYQWWLIINSNNFSSHLSKYSSLNPGTQRVPMGTQLWFTAWRGPRPCHSKINTNFLKFMMHDSSWFSIFLLLNNFFTFSGSIFCIFYENFNDFF